jgi:hypothetical protein
MYKCYFINIFRDEVSTYAGIKYYSHAKPLSKDFLLHLYCHEGKKNPSLNHTIGQSHPHLQIQFTSLILSDENFDTLYSDTDFLM